VSDGHAEIEVEQLDQATEAADLSHIDEVAVSLDLNTLTEAIQRAKRTVAGLEAFVESDLAALKASCERQLAACQEECDRALEEARTKSGILHRPRRVHRGARHRVHRARDRESPPYLGGGAPEPPRDRGAGDRTATRRG
jgi:hypothetical protein